MSAALPLEALFEPNDDQARFLAECNPFAELTSADRAEFEAWLAEREAERAREREALPATDGPPF